MKECVSIHVGQTGCRIGEDTWRLFGLEHDMQSDGSKHYNTGNDDYYKCFYTEMETGTYSPRAVFVDSDIASAYAIRRSPIGALLQPDQLISGQEDSSDLYPRGCYASGEDYPEQARETIRRTITQCDNLQGFLISHSIGGGTGSGCTSLLLEHLCTEYHKKTKFNFTVFPSKKVSTSVVDPYNVILSMTSLINFTDIDLVLDNGAIYDICEQKLNLEEFDFKNMNKVIGHVISNVTTPLRFASTMSSMKLNSGTVNKDVDKSMSSSQSSTCIPPKQPSTGLASTSLDNIDLHELQSNIAINERLHFPIASFAPIQPIEKSFQRFDIKDLTRMCFDQSFSTVSCNLQERKCLAMYLLYRGEVLQKNINDAIKKMKELKKIPLVGVSEEPGDNKMLPLEQWIPSEFKIAITKQKLSLESCSLRKTQVFRNEQNFNDNNNLAESDTNACMLCNTASVTDLWKESCRKFDLMYSQRSFVHWYVEEGLEEGEFLEARENVENLINEYNELNNTH